MSFIMFLSNDILDEFLWNEKDKLKGEFVKINENQSNKSINKYEESLRMKAELRKHFDRKCSLCIWKLNFFKRLVTKYL